MARQQHKHRRSRERRFYSRPPLAFEALEPRIVLAELAWVGLGAGSNFDTITNWAEDGAPAPHAPTSDDPVEFNNAQPNASVLFTKKEASATLEIASGDVGFGLNGYAYTVQMIRVGAEGDAALSVQNSSPTATGYLFASLWGFRWE